MFKARREGVDASSMVAYLWWVIANIYEYSVHTLCETVIQMLYTHYVANLCNIPINEWLVFIIKITELNHREIKQLAPDHKAGDRTIEALKEITLD